MTRRVAIADVSLSYRGGLVLHTATSGAVPSLRELRLFVTEGERLVAAGASRVNIDYLNGIPAEAAIAAALAAARVLDWRLDWPVFVPALDARCPDLPAPARMLFEMAAADGAARAAGVSLSAALGGPIASRVPTNQTLFQSSDEDLVNRAAAYTARGFTDLKLRVGFGPFADDLRRLSLLRRHFGDRILLSADVNGQWSEADAIAHLTTLTPLGLRYVEQPIAAGDWDAIGRVGRSTTVPLMLDESLSGETAVAALIGRRLPVLAHLKLAKLGGLDRLMRAGRALGAAGLPVMVGQMNEGAISTLAAAHAAVALSSPFRELYGADGLVGDPAGPLTYDQGHLHLLPGPGLGALHHEEIGHILWESEI